MLFQPNEKKEICLFTVKKNQGKISLFLLDEKKSRGKSETSLVLQAKFEA
jgi:hypothetical protein